MSWPGWWPTASAATTARSARWCWFGLDAGEHFEWLTFRRMNTGRVARDSNGGYVDQGRPLGMFLAEVVAELLEEGLLQVGEVSPRDNLARVSLSEAGAARYSELCRRQRAPRPAPPAEQASTETPVGDRPDSA